jgi:hypothetical protein
MLKNDNGSVVCFPRRLQIGTVYVALSISNAVVRGVFSDLVADVESRGCARSAGSRFDRKPWWARSTG